MQRFVAQCSSLQFRVLSVFMVVYLLLVTGAVLLWPANEDAEMFHSKRQAWTPDGHLTFESHFTSWDAEHYLRLSERGYEAGDPTCAFYPLWPLLVRWTSVLTRGNHVVAGMVVANMISLSAFLIFFELVRKRFGSSVAWLSLVFLVTFPGSVFFHFVYTEGLFLLLLMLLWLGLERGWFWLSATAAFLLPLTRAVGVFCVFPIFWDAITRAILLRRSAEPRRGRWDFNVRSAVQSCILLMVPICGWELYFLLMQTWTGNAFEGFEAQKHWGVQSIGNLFDVPKFVMGFVSPTSLHEFVGSLLDRVMFLGFLYCLPLVWRLDKGWFIWGMVLGVVPAMSGTLCSFTRFMSVVFPVPIALALLCDNPKLRWVRWPILGVFVVLHGALVWRFVNYRWAG